MITLIEYTEGYEPLWDAWDGDKYVGELDINTFDIYLSGLKVPFEIVKG